MADKDEIIEIPADEPRATVRVTLPVDGAVVPVPPAAAKPAEESDAIVDLKKQVDDANARAESERRERVRLETENRSVRSEVQNSNMVALSTLIDNVDRVLKEHKTEYAEMLAAGEYAKAADIQEKIASAAYDKRNLEAQKSDVELQIQRPTAEGRVPPVREAPSNALEDFASKLPAKSAQWLRDHPEAYTRQAKMLAAAHTAAVDLEGIVHESPEYFAYIEKRLGLGDGEVTRTDPPPREADTRSPPMAAPVSRQAPSISGRRPTGPRTVDLTPEMQRIAADMEMTPQEYAAEQLALMDEGKISRH